MTSSRTHGIALVMTVAVLTILSLVGFLFVNFTQLFRLQARAVVLESHARLLARSGVESAFSRMSRRVTSPRTRTYANRGDDWTCRDDPSVPLDRVQNPSYALGEPYTPAGPDDGRFVEGVDVFDPALHDLDGNRTHTGISGRLRGVLHPWGDTYRLRILPVSAIHLNDVDVPGGEDADGDGTQTLGTVVNGFPFADVNEPDLNGNGVFDPTRLVFMLNNLALVLRAEGRGGALSGREGSVLMAARAAAGGRFVTLEEVSAALGGGERYRQIAPYLTLHAWCDAKVVEPVRLLQRPFLAYRNWNGSSTNRITGYGDVAYAWKNLNPGRVRTTTRAPIPLGSAPLEVLAACFSGLSGLYLSDEIHTLYPGAGSGVDADGSTGRYHYSMSGRLKYRYDKGVSDLKPENRWPTDNGRIGILRRSAPISLAQAREIAREVVLRRNASGPFRGWQEFETWVDASLPLDEDLPRGTPYTRSAEISAEPPEPPNGRLDAGEDIVNPGVLDRQVFRGPDGVPGSGDDVPGLDRYQKDCIKAMANPNTRLNDLNPDAILYRDIDKTDLAIWTTELSLGPVGYFDIESIGYVCAAARDPVSTARVAVSSKLFDIYRETTQADFLREPLLLPPDRFLRGDPRSLDGPTNNASPPPTLSQNLGLVPTDGGRALLCHPEPVAPQMADPASLLRSGGMEADGCIGLATVESVPSALGAPALRMDYSSLGVDAAPGDGWSNGVMTDDLELTHVRSPTLYPPSGPSDTPGALRPDGLYSELHASARYPIPDDAVWDLEGSTMRDGAATIMFWWKPHWFPERTQKIHTPWNAPCLYSLNGRPYLNCLGCFFFPALVNGELPAGGWHLDNAYSFINSPRWDERCLAFGYSHKWLSANASINWQSYILSRCLNHAGHVPGVRGHPALSPPDYLRHHRWIHTTLTWKSDFSSGRSRPTLRIHVNGRSDHVNGDCFAGVRSPMMISEWGDRYVRMCDRNIGNTFCFGAWAGTEQPPGGTDWLSSGPNMNGTLDATIDAIRVWDRWDVVASAACIREHWIDGRYYKQGDAFFTSAPIDATTLHLSAGTPVRVLSVSWTVYMPPDNGDPETPRPLQDPDVPVGPGALKMQYIVDSDAGQDWSPLRDDSGGVDIGATFRDRLRYRIHFKASVPMNRLLDDPLLVTPFLDDVTILYADGPSDILSWEE